MLVAWLNFTQAERNSQEKHLLVDTKIDENTQNDSLRILDYKYLKYHDKILDILSVVDTDEHDEFGK